MSTPKRASRKTTAAAKSTTKKSPAAKPKAAKKAAAKKTTAKKTASAKKASPASSRVMSAAQKTARKVAKKVAKIISKVVAKKKATQKAAQKTAAPPAPAKKKKTAAKAAGARRAAARVVKTPVARRPKSFATRDVEHSHGFPAHTPELPDTYGENRLVLMTKDPEYLFAYWEVTPEKKAEGEKAKRRGERYREALRLNWVARDIFERNFALLPVSHAARKWYLRVPFSGLAYQVEIGWLGESGHFVSLLASNPSDSPEAWTATRRRLKRGAGGDVLERALSHGRPSGSSERPAGAAESGNLSPDWDFPGPGAHSSSSVGTSKSVRRPAR